MLGNLNSVLSPSRESYQVALTHIRVNGNRQVNSILNSMLRARENGESLSEHYDDVLRLAQYV